MKKLLITILLLTSYLSIQGQDLKFILQRRTYQKNDPIPVNGYLSYTQKDSILIIRVNRLYQTYKVIKTYFYQDSKGRPRFLLETTKGYVSGVWEGYRMNLFTNIPTFKGMYQIKP